MASRACRPCAGFCPWPMAMGFFHGLTPSVPVALMGSKALSATSGAEDHRPPGGGDEGKHTDLAALAGWGWRCSPIRPPARQCDDGEAGADGDGDDARAAALAAAGGLQAGHRGWSPASPPGAPSRGARLKAMPTRAAGLRPARGRRGSCQPQPPRPSTATALQLATARIEACHPQPGGHSDAGSWERRMKGAPKGLRRARPRHQARRRLSRPRPRPESGPARAADPGRCHGRR